MCDIVNKYSNTFHKTIKIKPNDEYIIDFGIENNDKYPKFKIGIHARITKYKNIFAKDYATNWSKKSSVVEINKRRP